MKTRIPVAVATLFGFSVLVSGLVLFVTIPLSKKISERRTEIDSVRTSIAALLQQQRNIDTVSRSFAELNRKDEDVASVFLSESRSVSFFDELDALGDQLGISEVQKRLDDPNDAAGDQLIGLQVSFVTSYKSALTFVRELLKLSVLISPTDISLSQATRPGFVSVSIESQIPWARQ